MKKDQFIIAYITDFGSTETVVSYSLFMASMLRKGLILLHICDPRYSRLTPDEAEKELQKLQHEILQDQRRASQIASLGVTYAAFKGDSKQVISALPTLLNAVVIVAEVDAHARRNDPRHRKSILRNFAECKTAFLVAQEPLEKPVKMRDVAMAVDFKKESKDKMIWSSYFPRFGNSRMHLLSYDYKDEFLRSKWSANMTQLQKLYSGLGISFSQHIMQSKSTFLDINALHYAQENGYGLLISVTTKEKDGLEFFIGVQEQRTIVNKARLPILFLNPREDLYVLCD